MILKDVPIDFTEKDIRRLESLRPRLNDDKCWPLTLKSHPNGYHQVYFRGQLYWAHRLYYALQFRQNPGQMRVCHTCDNPSCNNPAHFFLGTSIDNMQDAKRKGRTQRGERHSHAKLTDAAIQQIITRLTSTEDAMSDIAKDYGVSQSLISSIWKRKIWQHLPIDQQARRRSCVRMRGENHPNAELTDEKVITLRALYAKGEVTHQEIATQFSLTRGAVQSMLSGASWKHLPVPNKPPRRKSGYQGENNASAKLSLDDIQTIKTRLAQKDNQRQIADDFGVSPATICNIKKGKVWNY